MGPLSEYQKYFKTLEARSPALIEEAQRIRYEVYCREFGYEDPAAHADGLEKDAYDAHSRHCVLFHKPSGLSVGCVRLILADQSRPEAKFPFEDSCGDSIWRHEVDPTTLVRSRFGEISRLAIRREFRRRRTERSHPDGFDAETEALRRVDRRHIPRMVIGLYLAGAAVGLSNGLDSVFAMMEPRLARHLAVVGIRFKQVSDLVEHRGQRAVFQITRRGLFDNLNPDIRGLLDAIRADLASSSDLPDRSQERIVA